MEIVNIKDGPKPLSASEPVSTVYKGEKRVGASKAVEVQEVPTFHTTREEKIPVSDPEKLEALVENINRAMKNMKFTIQFVVDREAGGVIIKVVDSEGKLIRQIPPDVMAACYSQAGVDLGFLLNMEL